MDEEGKSGSEGRQGPLGPVGDRGPTGKVLLKISIRFYYPILLPLDLLLHFFINSFRPDLLELPFFLFPIEQLSVHAARLTCPYYSNLFFRTFKTIALLKMLQVFPEDQVLLDT